MSNEYKDWLWDAAQDYLFNEVAMIEKIECTTEFEDGYLMVCRHLDGSKGCYFVWHDEESEWHYKFIII